jgi:ribosomal protein S14
MSACPLTTACAATSSELKKVISTGTPRSLVRSMAMSRFRLSTLAMSPKAILMGSDWASVGAGMNTTAAVVTTAMTDTSTLLVSPSIESPPFDCSFLASAGDDSRTHGIGKP